ncbi:hypothetical protein AVDCRST_MAG94-6519 [uncultured Leptolyngbya sp.]|uniref:Uncharacterized protein n=1 Tax=uncultured Leptolyngbya sp. TaxID=332963 RepID=A0A6J4PG58_9CYAN|nr:hypothetical protein AVDCRST_MAG94-6519 [uncultured Leptolyngbya sp.]
MILALDHQKLPRAKQVRFCSCKLVTAQAGMTIGRPEL